MCVARLFVVLVVVENYEDYGDGIWRRNDEIVSLGENSRDIKIGSTRAAITIYIAKI